MYKFLKIYPWLFLCFFLFSDTTAFAQNYNFKSYSVREGLPYVQVFSIAQDSKGNLWTGGYGGLSKFDGKFFENFGPRNGLINNRVVAIAEDNSGSLWIGTTNGVSRFFKNKFYNFSVKNGLPGNRVHAIFVDKIGNVFIGTDAGLSVVFSNQLKENKISFKNITTKEGLPENKINSITQDSNADIFLSTDMGLCVLGLDKENIKIKNKISVWDGLAGNIVKSICADNKGGIWAGTNNGLSFIKNNKITTYKTEDGLSSNKILSVVRGLDKELWIGTESGLDCLSENKFVHFNLNKNNNKINIECLFVDFENNLWIGSYPNGLIRFSNKNFVSFNENSGLLNAFVFPINSDKQGNIWIGTEAAGLFKFDGKKFKQFSTNNGLPSNKINDMLFDNDKLWVATESGLVKVDVSSSSNAIVNVNPNFTEAINAFTKDKNSNIWIGAKKSILKFDASLPNTFTRINIKSNIPDFDVWYLLSDSKNNIWIGTYLGGLYKYDGKEIIEFGSKLGIKSDTYLSILEDKLGNIYLGTFEGVFVYNPQSKKIIHFDEKDGLSSDIVYAMTFDDKGKLWVGTNQGVNRIDIPEFQKTGKKIIRTFGMEEGFTGVECNSNGIFKDAKGYLWWGTVNGLIRFHPEQIKENHVEAKLNFTNLKVNEMDTSVLNDMAFDYDMNNIEINFIGISFANPEKIKYSYMLAGFEKDWSVPSSNNIVRYSNLPPGNYVFKVKSTNSIGMWNKQEAAFTFVVNPPFWKTWWFYLLTVLVLGISIERFVRHRIKMIKFRERTRFHQKIRLALTELRALRAQMNPHFIFNSLNSIQHFIVNRDTESATHYLNKFARLMRTILNNSERSSITLREEIDALRLYLELESMRFENKFHYRIQIESSLDIDTVEVPPMLIQPYIENAIIHGMIPNTIVGLLEIDMKTDSNHLICTISDNGVGRKFSGDKQIKNNTHRSMGMKLTRDSLEVLNHVHNSNLSVTVVDLENEKGESQGTRVELFIPIN